MSQISLCNPNAELRFPDVFAVSGMISALGRVVPVHADKPKLLPLGGISSLHHSLLHLASALDLPLCGSALRSTEPLTATAPGRLCHVLTGSFEGFGVLFMLQAR